MFLGGLGLFGEGIKNMYENVSEFDKTNYTIIPMGLTPEGETVYLRIPNDEVGRFISGIIWKLINIESQESGIRAAQDITEITAGQLPSIAPLIELSLGWMTYISGQKPYDFFKGRLILNQDEQRAGGWYSLKPMIQWTGQKLALPSFLTTGKRKDDKLWKKVLRNTPVLQRYIKVSNWGKIEKERLEREKYYKKRSQYKIKRYKR